MARVVVIGAGVGGLAAAARLGAVGHDVAVCEQAERVGGKLGVVECDGYRFDTGPSLLTMPHVARDLFTATGRPLDAVLELQPVEPIARHRFADGTWFESSSDLERLCDELDDRLAPGSGDDWRRFRRHAAAVWEAVHRPFLQRSVGGAADLARQAVRLRDLAVVRPWMTLRDVGRRYLRDPRLRMVLERYATYTGSDPRRAPAALAAIPHAEQTFGAWHVRGGLYRLAEALADRARERGATLRCRADVSSVELTGGRVSGVRLAGGERLRADVVVANTDAEHLYRDLVPGPAARRALRRLRRATPSMSGFVLLLGLRGRTPGVAHHTVLFPERYDEEFDAVFGHEPRPVPDPTLYVSVPGDASAHPSGGEAWFVLANAPRQGPVDWTAPGLADDYADRLVTLLADRGMDVRGRVACRHVITPADLARRTRAVGGAIYGSSSNGARAAFLRPANRSPVAGLFLVGGSAHPGGGIPLVMLSARIVAGLVGRA